MKTMRNALGEKRMRWLIGRHGSRLTRSRGDLGLVADVLLLSCCDPVHVLPM